MLITILLATVPKCTCTQHISQGFICNSINTDAEKVTIHNVYFMFIFDSLTFYSSCQANKIKMWFVVREESSHFTVNFKYGYSTLMSS